MKIDVNIQYFLKSITTSSVEQLLGVSVLILAFTILVMAWRQK